MGPRVCISAAGAVTSAAGGGNQYEERLKRAVEVAGEAQPQTHATASFPLPQRGGVIFYLVTDSGVFTATTTEAELNSTSHPLRKLGDAMQEVITQYRLWGEQRKKTQSE